MSRYALFGIVLLLLVTGVYFVYQGAAGERVLWTSGSNGLDELNLDSFYIVLFPLKETTDDGIELNRAYLSSLEENGKDEFQIYIDDDPKMIDRKLLTAWPDEATYQEQVDALDREVERWGDSSVVKHVSYAIEKRDEAKAVIRVSIKDDRGRMGICTYECNRDGEVSPKKLLFRLFR